LSANLLSPRRPSHDPTVRQCRSSEQFSHATGFLSPDIDEEQTFSIA